METEQSDKAHQHSRERLEWLLTHSTDEWEIGEDVVVVRMALASLPSAEVPNGYVEECEAVIRHLSGMLRDVQYRPVEEWRDQVADFVHNGIKESALNAVKPRPALVDDDGYLVKRSAPSHAAPKTLSEFVHATPEVREAIGNEVVKGAIARQAAISSTAMHPAVERAVVLLECAADMGIDAKYGDGTSTPNSKLCSETAKALRALPSATQLTHPVQMTEDRHLYLLSCEAECLLRKPRITGVDPARPGGDFTGYACSCGQVRVGPDGPCEKTDCPIPSSTERSA